MSSCGFLGVFVSPSFSFSHIHLQSFLLMLASKQSGSTVQLSLLWLFVQSPPNKNKYTTLCEGHSELPIHADPCLSQSPQQPITTAMECRETIATARPWMLLAGSIQRHRKETEVKCLKSIPLSAVLLMDLQAQTGTCGICEWLSVTNLQGNGY